MPIIPLFNFNKAIRRTSDGFTATNLLSLFYSGTGTTAVRVGVY